jgi:hypothetical protein
VNPSPFRTSLATSDLCETFVTGENVEEVVPCALRLGRASLPIDIPVRVLEEHRASGGSAIVLAVPAEAPRPVRRETALSPTQQKEAGGWVAAMEDFDRF